MRNINGYCNNFQLFAIGQSPNVVFINLEKGLFGILKSQDQALKNENL
jgi:hypothetical protein